MNNAFVKQECVTCKGHGLLPPKGSSSKEALICPHCEGKGWLALNYKKFEGRTRLAGVTLVRTTTGLVRYLGEARQPAMLSLIEFEERIPSEQ
jgi:hypothetical protein